MKEEQYLPVHKKKTQEAQAIQIEPSPGTSKALIPVDEPAVIRWINSGYKGSLILLVVLSGIYALSPIDAIPDFIPVLGQADDIGVIISSISSMTLLTIARPFVIAIMKRPAVRAGCLAVTVVGAMIMLLVAIVVFYLVYLLINWIS